LRPDIYTSEWKGHPLYSLPKNDGPTTPTGGIVEKRVCGIFGLVIAEGFKPFEKKN
jgi:hypothetical protein